LDTSFWWDEKIVECCWLEKFVFVHLLMREELNTTGVVAVPLESIELLLNGNGTSVVKEYPVIEKGDVLKALEMLEGRKLVAVDTKGGLTVYFRNFLKYQDWSSKVVKSWPRRVGQIHSPKLKRMVRRDCRRYCRERGYRLPEGL
jgi:hypothetical protein